MEITNKSECPSTTDELLGIVKTIMMDVILSMAEGVLITSKDIGTEDRVAFFSRAVTFSASFDDMHTIMLRCRQRHYKLVASYVDIDEFDTRQIRPEFKRMLADAHDHMFDVLVIPSTACISRELNQLTSYIAELQVQGIRIALIPDALTSAQRLASKPNREASA